MNAKAKFRFRSLITRSPEEVYDWHLRDRVLERCIPPSDKMEIVYSNGRLDQEGYKIEVRTKILNLFWIRQVLKYSGSIKNESFSLKQVEGFFDSYDHKTVITAQSSHTSEIIDTFEVSPALPKFLMPLVNGYLKKRIGKILAYKHELIDFDIGMIRKYPFEKPLRILITGSHGLIGRNVAYFLEFMGHDVCRLSRKHQGEEKTVIWNPKTGECNSSDFEGFDALIHLAGENIGKGRWTRGKKKKILKSRVNGTEKLVQIIKGLKNPPKTFISASAVGYYGNRGSEVLTEESSPGKGLFISKVCEEWERASRDLDEMGIRTVETRFGMVLSSAGGALKQMLPFFKWGLGGKIGNGHQFVSWVAIDDVVGGIYHVMMTPSLKGAVNIVSPNPIPNDIFTKKLAKRLNRFVGPPLPECVILALLGQKGKELLLTSLRVEPHVLSESGYNFHYPKLCQALEHII